MIRRGTLLGEVYPVDGITNNIHDMSGLQEEEPVCYFNLPEEDKEWENMVNRSKQYMDTEEINKVRQLVHGYSDIFATPSRQMGCTDMMKHTIDTGNATPIKQPLRRKSPEQQVFIEKEIDKMLKGGVIQRSNSPWSSPITLAKKKNGSWRFCLDYRKLNNVTIKDAFPLPSMQDAIQAFSGCQFFSSLDMSAAYWQVPLAEDSREKTAFATRSGLYEFIRLQFGISNAPGAFVRLMEKVMRGIDWIK